jgi:predicted site-specific integrase-resolvase
MLRPREVCEKLGVHYMALREYVRGAAKPVVPASERFNNDGFSRESSTA